MMNSNYQNTFSEDVFCCLIYILIFITNFLKLDKFLFVVAFSEEARIIDHKLFYKTLKCP